MSNKEFTDASEQMLAMIEWACARGIAFVGFVVIDGRVASADHVDCKDIANADNVMAKR